MNLLDLANAIEKRAAAEVNIPPQGWPVLNPKLISLLTQLGGEKLKEGVGGQYPPPPRPGTPWWAREGIYLPPPPYPGTPWN